MLPVVQRPRVPVAQIACLMRGFLFISGTDPVGHLFATAKDVNKAVESLVQVMTSDDEGD